MDTTEAMSKRILLADLFTPAAPIEKSDLFVGRATEINKLMDVFAEKGKHAILFGDRGVGKTSLANIFRESLDLAIQKAKLAELQILTAKVTCTAEDTLESVSRSLFGSMLIPVPEKPLIGFGAAPPPGGVVPLSSFLPSDPTPDSMRKLVDASGLRFLLIVDEFDRLPLDERRRFADLVKLFSDNDVKATMMLVGVADDINTLLASHPSTERALQQIRLPRLSPDDSRTILSDRLPKVGMTMGADAEEGIIKLAQGLPHVVHALGLEAAKAALDRQSLEIGLNDAIAGVSSVVQSMDQSLVRAYGKAIYSARKDALYSKVLCACAIAQPDEEGFFNARLVLPHMKSLHTETSEISTFNQHLERFSEAKRGPVLDRIGDRRDKRYRFRNPLMRVFVMLRSVKDGRISFDQIPLF